MNDCNSMIKTLVEWQLLHQQRKKSSEINSCTNRKVAFYHKSDLQCKSFALTLMDIHKQLSRHSATLNLVVLIKLWRQLFA